MLQCNTHKYLLLFHRVNIQLTVTPRQRDSNRGDKTLKKKKVQRTEKVDDKEKLQLDTVRFNILHSELVLHIDKPDTFPVKWQVVRMKLNFQSPCLRPCGVINLHSSSNEKDVLVFTYNSSK